MIECPKFFSKSTLRVSFYNNHYLLSINDHTSIVIEEELLFNVHGKKFN